MKLSARRRIALAAALTASGAAAAPQSAQDLQGALEVEAREASRSFSGFSAQVGERFFRSTHGNGCASCHSLDPRNAGKEIAPLAPTANPRCFTSVEKVEKWFRRNCGDVLGRACSTEEKGDVIAYLLSLK